MAQKTKTWDSLTALVQARLGHDLSDKDLARVGELANSAALTLYDETPWWERYLVLEPRSVERGYIQFDEEGYNVYGAGESEANGLYKLAGSGYYLKYDGGYEMIKIISISPSTVSWEIRVIGGESLYSTIPTDPSEDPQSEPTNSFFEVSGESPSPAVQALSEIGEYIGHWNGQVFTCAGATAGTAHPDHNGIRITNCNSDDVVYVAFKKTLDDTFGDGESGTTSDIPAEWWNFMALQTASAWDGAQDRPTVRVKDIDRAWDQALLKVNRQGIYQSIGNRFRTYYGYDVSVR